MISIGQVLSSKKWWLSLMGIAGFTAGATRPAEAMYCEYNYCDTFLIDECKPIAGIPVNCDATGSGCTTLQCN